MEFALPLAYGDLAENKFLIIKERINDYLSELKETGPEPAKKAAATPDTAVIEEMPGPEGVMPERTVVAPASEETPSLEGPAMASDTDIKEDLGAEPPVSKEVIEEKDENASNIDLNKIRDDIQTKKKVDIDEYGQIKE